MELRHLRYFVAVAEERHLTRAAERLGIQQPPLSQQIHALERELGLQLFRRKPRGMEPTEAGEALLGDARGILEQVERARARAGRTARGEQGTLAIGFTSSAPFHPLLPQVIRAFREQRPLVTLRLEELGTGELVEALRAERIDVAFIRSRVADTQGIAVYPLLQEPMLAALPNDHRLAARRRARAGDALALGELAAEPFILYRRPNAPGFYAAIIAACHQAGYAPQIVQEAPRVVSTLNLVAAGLGVTLVPESLRQLELAGLVYRPLKSRPALTARLDLACRRTDHSAAARQFVALARAAAARLRKPA